MKRTTYLFVAFTLFIALTITGCKTAAPVEDTGDSNTNEEIVVENDNDEEVDEDTEEQELPPVQNGANEALPPTENQQSNSSSETTEEKVEVTKYIDGSYTQTGTYTTPAGTDSVIVTVTVESDQIASVNVEGASENSTSQKFQKLFIDGVQGEVAGIELDKAFVSNVNGSSLTPNGFNQAVKLIKAQATKQ